VWPQATSGSVYLTPANCRCCSKESTGDSRNEALLLYGDHGIAEIDNNAAERSLRGVALGRKNFLFMGADSGGERAAAMYALIGTAKLSGIDP